MRSRMFTTELTESTEKQERLERGRDACVTMEIARWL